MALLRSAATVSGLTLCSRVTGLARDVVIASAYGAGPLTDAFWVAFRIPNLLRRLFAEGAFSQAFVPILGQVRTNESAEAVQSLLDRVARLLTLALMLATLLGVLAAPWVIAAMGSGMLVPERQTEYQSAVWMTRLMFPYIVCMSLVALASGVLNTYSRFAVPAFTPVLLNLAMIAASIGLSPYVQPPIHALAIGVVAGGILQLGVQWRALARLGLRPRIAGSLGQAWRDARVRRVLRQMAPAILGVSVAQISILINTNIATWLAPGSVTWLSFADRLMEFPSALLGVALGTVLLPQLARAHAQQDAQRYQALVDWGLRWVLLLGLPAALGLALMADALVATLFHTGAFTAHDVAQTRLAVVAYAAGLAGLLAIKILAPGFYARQDIRTPVRVAITALVCTQLMNLAFVPWLGHVGLALSVGLGATVNSLLLLGMLMRRGIYRPAPGWGKFLLRLSLALLALAGALWTAADWADWIALGAQPARRALMLLGVVGAGALTYGASLWILGWRPRDLLRERQA